MAERSMFEGWAILELMGHRRLGGYLSEVEVAGKGFIRLDVPGVEGPAASQAYSPQAVYCITPTTEETATAVARAAQPAPVQRWELPQLEAPHRSVGNAELEGDGEGTPW